MDSCHPKAVFQIIVGARQSLDVIAMKQTTSEVVGDMTKMFKGLTQRTHVGFLFLHLTHESEITLTNLGTRVLLGIGQDVCRLMHQPVGALQWRPQRRRGLHPFGQELLQPL
jgi:hypothetical protein